MTRRANAIVITLIIVAIAALGAYGAYRLIRHYSRSPGATSTTASAVIPSPVPPVGVTVTPYPSTDPSNTGLDSQMNSIQTNINQMDQDQSAYSQINQSSDSNVTLP